jgi:hypothetical protein
VSALSAQTASIQEGHGVLVSKIATMEAVLAELAQKNAALSESVDFLFAPGPASPAPAAVKQSQNEAARGQHKLEEHLHADEPNKLSLQFSIELTNVDLSRPCYTPHGAAPWGQLNHVDRLCYWMLATVPARLGRCENGQMLDQVLDAKAVASVELGPLFFFFFFHEEGLQLAAPEARGPEGRGARGPRHSEPKPRADRDRDGDGDGDGGREG